MKLVKIITLAIVLLAGAAGTVASTDISPTLTQDPIPDNCFPEPHCKA